MQKQLVNNMNYIVESNQNIVIEEQGVHRIEVRGNSEITLRLLTNTQVLVTYTGVEVNCKMDVEVKKGHQTKVLHWNDCSGTLDLQVEYNLGNDSELTTGISELTGKNAKYDVKTNLLRTGSVVNFHSATIAKENVEFNIQMMHTAPHTSINMENYALVQKGAKLKIVDEGNIQKGAYGAASHQTTRVLTLDRDQSSEVVPLLLIDENDVKASHATSVGQPDENQLYYLQTRGLSRVQALGLMSIGYVLPITEIIKDETIEAELKLIVENRVEGL